MGRNVVPFMLGEVGVSDRLTYTKLKSKLWIEKGCGNVCSLFFSPHRTGQIECCIKAGIGFCCQKECNRVEDYRIRLGGDNETAKTGGQPIVTRTPIILTEHVVCLFMFSNQ